MRIFDAHCDTLSLICDSGGTLKNNSFHFDLTRAGNEHRQIFACFISPEYSQNAMSRFLSLANVYRKSNIDGILSIEGADMIESEDDVLYVKNMGVKVITPVWNYENKIATGALGDTKRGFTEFGKDIIRVFNREDILIDYSHMSDKSFDDCAAISAAPIIATHSNSRVICNNPRNLTDEQFLQIVKSGGCVGINFYPPFLNKSECATTDDIIKHIFHFLELGGEDSIGFGSDFDGVEYLPEGINGCEDMKKIVNTMKRHNFKEEIIEKICHKNWERIFGAN